MTDKLRDAAQQALEALDNMTDSQSNPARRNFPTIHDYGKSRRAADTLRAALAQQDAQAVPVVWMGKMDFEALKLRGRVTATLYGEPVGNKTHEVGLCLATPTPPCRRSNHD